MIDIESPKEKKIENFVKLILQKEEIGATSSDLKIVYI